MNLQSSTSTKGTEDAFPRTAECSPVSVGPGGDACESLEKPSSLGELDGPRGRMAAALEKHLPRLFASGSGPLWLPHHLL